MIQLAWTLTVITVGCALAASPLIRFLMSWTAYQSQGVWTRWSNHRYARRWGIPVEAFDEAVQQRVAAALRAEAIAVFGVSEAEWAEFVAAQRTAAEEAS